MLELICPTSPRPSTIFQQKDQKFFLDVAKLITEFQCDQEANDVFITKLFSSALGGNLYKDNPYFALKTAFYLEHEVFFSQAISHVVGQSSVFEEELDLLPEEVQSAVEKKAQELANQVGYVMEDVNSILVERLAGLDFGPANLIQLYVATHHGHSVLVRQEASPESYGALKSLYDLSSADWVKYRDVDSLILEKTDWETISEDDSETSETSEEGAESAAWRMPWKSPTHGQLIMKITGRDGEPSSHQSERESRGWRAIDFILESLPSKTPSALAHSFEHFSKLGIVMDEILEELYETLEFLFEGDQGLGYFTPIFYGPYPWYADADTDSNSSQEEYKDMTKEAGFTQVLPFRSATQSA